MAFDFAALKAQVRQTVHDTLSIAADYSDDNTSPVELRVRFHTKINRFGDMLDQGWAEVVEGVNRLIFNKPELDQNSVTLRRGGKVTFTDPHFEGIVLVLHVQEPDSGPIDAIWQVSQE